MSLAFGHLTGSPPVATTLAELTDTSISAPAASNSLIWAPNVNKWANRRDFWKLSAFGGNLDNATLDDTAWALLVAAIGSGGGCVEVPGMSLVSQHVNFQHSHVWVEGIGPGSGMRAADGTGIIPLIFAANLAPNFSGLITDVGVKGMEIHCNHQYVFSGTATGTQSTTQLQDTSQSAFSNALADGNHYISFYGPVTDLLWERRPALITGVSGSNIVQFAAQPHAPVTGQTQYIITNQPPLSGFSGSTFEGRDGSCGVVFAGVQRASLLNCYIHDSANSAADFEECLDWTVDNCWFDQNGLQTDTSVGRLGNSLQIQGNVDSTVKPGSLGGWQQWPFSRGNINKLKVTHWTDGGVDVYTGGAGEITIGDFFIAYPSKSSVIVNPGLGGGIPGRTAIGLECNGGDPWAHHNLSIHDGQIRGAYWGIQVSTANSPTNEASDVNLEDIHMYEIASLGVVSSGSNIRKHNVTVNGYACNPVGASGTGFLLGASTTSNQHTAIEYKDCHATASRMDHIWDLTGSETSGGTFPAGTYYWMVTPFNWQWLTTNNAALPAGSIGEANTTSGGSVVAETTQRTLTLNQAEQLNWTPNPGAAGYCIYRTDVNGATKTETLVTTLYGSQYSSFLDTGPTAYPNGGRAHPGDTNTTGGVGTGYDITKNAGEVVQHVTYDNCKSYIYDNDPNGSTGFHAPQGIRNLSYKSPKTVGGEIGLHCDSSWMTIDAPDISQYSSVGMDLGYSSGVTVDHPVVRNLRAIDGNNRGRAGYGNADIAAQATNGRFEGNVGQPTSSWGHGSAQNGLRFKAGSSANVVSGGDFSGHSNPIFDDVTSAAVSAAYVAHATPPCSAIRNVGGVTPVGLLTSPPATAINTATTTFVPFDCWVACNSTTITSVQVGPAGSLVTVVSSPPANTAYVLVPAGQSLRINGTGTPTAVWYAL